MLGVGSGGPCGDWADSAGGSRGVDRAAPGGESAAAGRGPGGEAEADGRRRDDPEADGGRRGEREAHGGRGGAAEADGWRRGDDLAVPSTAREDERLAWAVLVGVEGIGPVTLAALVRAFGSGRAALEAAAGANGPGVVRAAIGALGGRLDERVATAIADGANAAGAFAGRLEGIGVAVVTLDDPAYPGRLRLLEMPPPVLFVRGALGSLEARRPVAVVGTRRPTERGRRLATAIAAALAGNGAVVVSGLALGIDGAAHAACMDAGGTTVAVLGAGHARLYPAAHKPLADRIVAGGGAVISELAPDVPAVAGTFPRRNRVIAGLADATVIVEAGPRSGALITAGWALEQGRECFVVPGPVGVEQSLGCNRLLRSYPGQARAVPGIPELLEDLDLVADAGPPAIEAAPRASGGARPASLDALLASLGAAEAAVARALRPRAATLDELVLATGHTPAALLAVLTRLEDRGLAVPALGRYAPAGDLAEAAPAWHPG